MLSGDNWSDSMARRNVTVTIIPDIESMVIILLLLVKQKPPQVGNSSTFFFIKYGFDNDSQDHIKVKVTHGEINMAVMMSQVSFCRLRSYKCQGQIQFGVLELSHKCCFVQV